MSSTPLGSTVLLYPRIGPDRELKRAVEGYWAGRTPAAELAETAQALRAQTWTELAAAGLARYRAIRSPTTTRYWTRRWWSARCPSGSPGWGWRRWT